MQHPLSFLSLEENRGDAQRIRACLCAAWPDCTVRVVRDRRSFEQAFEKGGFDLILAGSSGPGWDGREVLAWVRQRDPDVPFIFVTSAQGEEWLVESIRNGATDCVLKEHLARLVPATQRALAEAVLRRAELRYRVLFEQSPDAMVVIDPATTLPVEFNDLACGQLGYSRNEFAKLRVADYVLDRRRTEKRLVAALKAGRAEFETSLRTKKGDIVETWMTLRAVDLGQGQVLHTIWRDISAQRRARLELERSERYFRALTELGSDVVAVLAPDGGVRYVSPSVTRMLGYDPQALLQHNVFDLLHPEDQLLARDTLARVQAEPKGIAALEVRVRHQDGLWRNLEVVGQNLLHDATVAGIILSVRDVTDRKRAQARYFEQAALLDNAQDAILVCDLESKILFWNRSAERVYGWTAREALGKNADELLFAPEAPRPISAFKGLIAKGEWHGQLVQVHQNGEEVVVESRWSLVRDDEGEPKSILIINTDVTEMRKLQAQLLRAQRMEGIGALAGGIAHDLNNVLTPILIATELLQDTVGDAEGRRLLETLRGSAQRGAELVRQILSFARGTGETVADLQLRHLIHEHEKILRETLPRSIKLETSVPKGLWLVKGNATKLSQVLMNLSLNARDAMPNGGEIRLCARNVKLDSAAVPSGTGLKPGAYVVISVSDTGVGIPPDLLPRIFEPFFTTKDATKGTGLGLTTALGIVKSHGGALTVSSEAGRGTELNVYLPAVQTHTAPQTPTCKRLLPHGSGQVILVVDDESSSREMITATLANHGYKVLTASNGAEGLNVFRTQPDHVDLVLTDMAMPVMDGPSFIRALRSIRTELPVLAISGVIEPPGPNETAANLPILEKPCTAEELLVAVHRLLHKAAKG
jgi:two-component system cell cycle sensor histidine kinase/response regulator CckA